MGALLGLENLGLEASRDQISLMIVGDQTNNAQALEAGNIDVTTLDGVYTHRLKQKGFKVIAEFGRANIPFPGQGIVVSRAFLQKQSHVVEAFLKGLLEGIQYCLSLANKAAVIKTMTARLRIPDPNSAEIGYPGPRQRRRRQTLSVVRRPAQRPAPDETTKPQGGKPQGRGFSRRPDPAQAAGRLKKGRV